jgi:ABC-2 type transport system permease protein
MTLVQYGRCFNGIFIREVLRFVNQYGRFFAALVRPLVWLFIFAAGFRYVLGVSRIEPYDTYVLYEVYITPGLIGMIQLFNGMQSSLSMVYDREMGSMRTLMVSPFPRWYLLTSKLLASVLVSILQVYAYLLIASLVFNLKIPVMGYFYIIPVLILTGMMLGSVGLLLSSLIRQLENFAGVMNFVIFPMFFASNALNPLWRIRESSVPLFYICAWNPFTHVIQLIRFALHGKFYLFSAAALKFSVANPTVLQSLLIVTGFLILFLACAIYGYDPSRGVIARRGGPGGAA